MGVITLPAAASSQAASAVVKRQISETYAVSVTLDCDSYDVFDLVLTGNAAIDLIGGVDGQPILVRLKQDATGGRTVTWGSMVRFGTDITSVTLTTTAGKTDVIGLVYHAADGKYDVVSYSLGF